MKIIIPELLYTGGEFKKEYAVTVDGTKIRRIGSASELKKRQKEPKSWNFHIRCWYLELSTHITTASRASFVELQQTGRFSSGETVPCIIIPRL